MEYRELTEVAVLGSASVLDDLEMLIFQAATKSSIFGFRHFSPGDGTPNSIRVLSSSPFQGSAPFPQTLTSWDVARDLMSISASGEARYGARPMTFMQKGWVVLNCVLEGQAVIVAAAVWV